MADELEGVDTSGNTCYALIKNAAGQFWTGSAFETYASIDYADYSGTTMTEQGSSGIFLGDFPVSITDAGTYSYFVKRQAGGSPAESDEIVTSGKVDWTGSASAISITGAMSGSDWRDYVLRGGFKRTDKDTELYEETTDAIQEMRRRFGFAEAEVEKTTTDTISVLGDYSLSLESDFGLLMGVRVIDGQNGTPLIPKNKHDFDQLYPDITVTHDYGYPKHFCVFGGAILIGPIPDRTDFVYEIAYSQRAGTITSSTSSVPFTREYRDVLRDLTLAKLYKLLDEFDKAQFFRAEYDRGWEDAKHRERFNKKAGVFNVRPVGM